MSRKKDTLKCSDCKDSFPREELEIKYSPSGNVNTKLCKGCKTIREERQSLYKYLSKLYNMPMLTNSMKGQLKEYNEGGFRFKGMELTLKYCKEVLGLDFTDTKKRGLGIILYYYEDAKKYHIEKLKLKKNLEENSEKEIKVVNVKITKLDNTNHYKINKMTNWEELLNEC